MIIDINLQVAIIAAISALIGAAIPTILGYFYTKKLEQDKIVKEKQKEIYNHFFISIQKLMNCRDKDAEFPNFQNAVNQVCLYGDNKTSIKVNNYYSELTNRAMGDHLSLNDNEHDNYQKGIMNAMRESLGLKPLEKFRLITFSPASIDE